jgi:hypothetical protein
MTSMCSLCGRTTNQKGDLQDEPGVGTARTLEHSKLWKAMRHADPTTTAASVANMESDPIYTSLQCTGSHPLHFMPCSGLHSCTLTHTHAHSHKYTQPRAHVDNHARAHKRTKPRIHAHAHTENHTHTHTHTCRHTQACVVCES